MRTYHVQLADVETPAIFQADGDPVLGTTDDYGQPYWQFKQGEQVVAQFKQNSVLGWWYVETTRGQNF